MKCEIKETFQIMILMSIRLLQRSDEEFTKGAPLSCNSTPLIILNQGSPNVLYFTIETNPITTLI